MERLSEVDPAVNAIVVSGYAQDPAMTEYRDYGFKGVISKPFTLEELNATLHSVHVRHAFAGCTEPSRSTLRGVEA